MPADNSTMIIAHTPISFPSPTPTVQATELNFLYSDSCAQKKNTKSMKYSKLSPISDYNSTWLSTKEFCDKNRSYSPPRKTTALCGGCLVSVLLTMMPHLLLTSCMKESAGSIHCKQDPAPGHINIDSTAFGVYTIYHGVTLNTAWKTPIMDIFNT